MKDKSIPDKWLYFPIALFAFYFIIRLIDQSKILTVFPLDTVNDYSAHMAMLYFLKVCGFHNFCPYWYNGFILFKFYPPGWAFFTYPIYILTKNVQWAAFLSLLLMFLLGFIIIYLFGRSQKISVTQRIAFFFFYFANAIAIGNFIRLGRLPEMFAWICFLGFASFMIWYKNHKIDFKFIIPMVLFAGIVVSHQTTAVLSAFLFISLVLVKSGRLKEQTYILGGILFSFLLSSFWFIPYLKDVFKTSTLGYALSGRLLEWGGVWLLTNIASVIVGIALLVTFYYYNKSENNPRKEFIFFSPVLLIALLFLFRITPFVPILRQVYPDPHMTFFMFFVLFFFFKTNLEAYSELIKKSIFLLLIILPVSSILISVYHTPFFQVHTSLEDETISLFPHIKGRFVFLSTPPSSTSYPKAYFSYAPIYFDLSTVSGWTHQVKEKSYIDFLYDITAKMKEKNCQGFINSLDNVNASYMVAYGDDCDLLNKCSLKEIVKKEHACLYTKNE